MKSGIELARALGEPIDFGNRKLSLGLLGAGAVLIARDLLSSPNTLDDFGDTIGRQATSCALQGAGKLAFEFAGLTTGSATLDTNERALGTQLAEHPIRSFPDVVAAAPVKEETFFRALLSMTADAVHPRGRQTNRWLLGTLSSLWFATHHGIIQDGEMVYPVEQFIAGMGLWKLQREKGIKHAVFAHAALNTGAYPMMVLSAKTNARQKEQISSSYLAE